jgi:ABC-type multidrug transport system fused ATPase/permease subunit
MASSAPAPSKIDPSPPRLSVRGLNSAIAGPFDLELAPGACLAVTGASGSGKSLFLRLLADLDPGEGAVALDGVDRRSLPATAWRRKAPYVAAESGWWLERAADHFAADQRGAARELALGLGVGADAFEGEVQRLSTGEKQRLALVRALVLDPPVLFLDEPTAALDPVSTGKVEAVLKARLERGTSIVLVSHDAGQGARLGAIARTMRERRLEPAA